MGNPGYRQNIPTFDWRRWGPGAVLILGVLFGLGVAGFLDGLLRKSAGLMVVGTVLLLGGIVVLTVKLGEEIHPVTVKWDLEGERGETVGDLRPGARGVVRVRSELWTAKSGVLLRAGSKVRVVRTEGNIVWVEPDEGEDPLLRP